MARNQRVEKEEHHHQWVSSQNLSEKICSCGCVLISEQEFERRKKEWLDYFKLVDDSHAYKRFQQQMIAFDLGDVQFVKGCAEQARRDLVNKTDWIPKPHFPDPTTWQKYILEENLMIEAKKIFNVK